MKIADVLERAAQSVRLVQVASKSYTVNTYDESRGAYIQGATLDYWRARAAFKDARIRYALELLGETRDDAIWLSQDVQGDWRGYVRARATIRATE